MKNMKSTLNLTWGRTADWSYWSFYRISGLTTDWMQALIDSVRRWTEDKKALIESAQDRESKPASKPGREQLETSARPEEQFDLSRDIEPTRKSSHPHKPTTLEFLDFLGIGNYWIARNCG